MYKTYCIFFQLVTYYLHMYKKYLAILLIVAFIIPLKSLAQDQMITFSKIQNFEGPKNIEVNKRATWHLLVDKVNNETLYYTVSWGDGTKSTSNNIFSFLSFFRSEYFTHRYREAGSYDITVQIKSRYGTPEIQTYTVEVVDSSGNSNVLPIGYGCREDAKQCSDGTVVVRTGPRCEFAACPGDDAKSNRCPQDAKICSDGYKLFRSGPNCSFPSCPDPKDPVFTCQMAILCPDGTTVTGCNESACNSSKNKKVSPIKKSYPSIPPGFACTMEAKICPNGKAVGRTGPNCEFESCDSNSDAGSYGCPEDAKVCPNGKVLIRTGPKCTFPACNDENVSEGSAGYPGN